MQVTDAVAATLTALGADTVFGVVGSGNFMVTNALIARGARYVAARHEGGAAVMADAWARLTGRPGLVSRAPGARADQRDDRDHRGGQEPDAADRAGRRRGLRRRAGPTSASTWPALATAGGRGAAPAALPRVRGRRHRAGLPDRGDRSGAPWCWRCRWTCRPGRARCRRCRRSSRRRRRRPPPADGRDAGRARWPAARRPVFIAGRGARLAGARADLEALADALRRAAGHLGRGQGPVPRQPVGPGRERRLRLAAGRRADPRRPTWSSAGAAR